MVRNKIPWVMVLQSKSKKKKKKCEHFAKFVTFFHLFLEILDLHRIRQLSYIGHLHDKSIYQIVEVFCSWYWWHGSECTITGTGWHLKYQGYSSQLFNFKLINFRCTYNSLVNCNHNTIAAYRPSG